MTEIKKWAECQTIDDVLLKCAAVALDREPGHDQIPSEDDLWKWINSCSPSAAIDQAAQAAALLAPPLVGEETIVSWCFRRDEAVLPMASDKEQGRFDPARVVAFDQIEALSMSPDKEQDRSGLYLYAEAAFEARGGTWMTRSQVPILLLHVAWLSIPQGQRRNTDHPLIALVQAWQARPTPVDANDHKRPILPAKLAHTLDKKRLPRMSEAHHTPPGSQLILPGFGPQAAGGIQTALPLALYDLEQSASRARVASVSLRLWIEAVLNVKPKDRGYGPVVLQPTLKELRSWLYPEPEPGQKWRRRGKIVQLLYRAFEALDSPQARIVYVDPESGKPGLWRVVSLLWAPYADLDLDDRVRITVHLPPGSEQGPQIDRGRLRWWGVQSAPAYRALINLAYAWYAPGHLQRPADNSRRHWLQVQDPARYPLLTDGTAANLCFPSD